MTEPLSTEFYTPAKDKLGLRIPGPMRDDLPKVFLIGDSISCGYTEPVMERLRDVCNVRRAPDNCGDTRRGLRDLDLWLGQVQWDVIHFNWGLHDLAYRHPESTAYGQRDKVRGTISVPLNEYRENLDQLVVRLRAQCSRLIWASTTFVPLDDAGRFAGDEVRYNQVAAEIMNRHGIPINDLRALTAAFDATLFTAPRDVHYSADGSQVIANQVAQCIRNHLPERDASG